MQHGIAKPMSLYERYMAEIRAEDAARREWLEVTRIVKAFQVKA